jgi:HEAT repeat protein
MFVDYVLIRGIALFLAGLFGAALALRVLLRWRYAAMLARARRIAARLRAPASTLAAVEDQSAALDELTEFPDFRAAATAARELLGETDATIRSAAIEVLRETRALEQWSRELRKGSYQRKLRAIEALGEIGDERAVEELLEALGDDDPDVARAASHAIVARDPDYAAERLADALGSPNRRLAETAAATLVRMGEESVEVLVSRLASRSAQARRLAVESLGSTRERRSKDALLPLLEQDPEPSVRQAVAEALVRIDVEGAGQELRKAARSDPDWFVRARAFALLGEVNAPGAAEFLVESLAEVESQLGDVSGEEDLELVMDGPQRVRASIVTGLRLLRFTDDQIAAAERSASRAAAPAGDAAEAAAAIALLRDRDAARRVEGARQLGGAGEWAAEALRQALRDPDPLVRAEAARSLGRSGSRDYLEALAKCTRDPDASVRLAASTAMRAVVTRDAARELQE